MHSHIDFYLRNIGALNFQFGKEVLLCCGKCKHGASGRFVSLKFSTMDCLKRDIMIIWGNELLMDLVGGGGQC